MAVEQPNGRAIGLTKEENDGGTARTNGAEDEKKAEDVDDGIERGMKLDTKNFYREDYTHAWEDWTPDHEKMDADRLRNSKFAVIVRHEMDTSADSGLQLHSFTIQSPILRKILDKVFEGYRDISTKLKELTFNRPFHEFYFRWDKYVELASQETDETALEHIKLLDKTIRPVIETHVEHGRDLKKHRTVTFDYLWMLFEQDCEVYAKIDKEDRIFKLTRAQYRKTQTGVIFALTCKYVTYDGTSFGYANHEFPLKAFAGHRRVLELNVMPLSWHPQRIAVENRATERGHAFVDLQGVKYKSYTGFLEPADQRRRRQRIENGRVVIDAGLYNAQNAEDDQQLEPLHDMTEAFSETVQSPDPNDAFGFPNQFMFMPKLPTPPPSKRVLSRHDTDSAPLELEEHHYRLCDSLLRGYCLTSKQWGLMQVGGIRDIKWNVASFKRLVLPNDYKELILSFVESHRDSEDTFDDIVEGKGKGMIILLSGVPGVGKTLTAEAVAEEMKTPLYSMSAGQLGYDADTVEDRLQQVLEICTKWGAVLLLDECDVFLEQRQITDIHRNKLVAVFLRLLEYYQGCLFLTTNRAATADKAFKSRIDLIIDYPKLTTDAKRQVWHTFVRPSEDFPQNDSTITDAELDVLAKIDINGREIKNLVKNGRLLAKRKSEKLGMQHLRTVVSVQTGVPTIEDTEEVYPPLD